MPYKALMSDVDGTLVPYNYDAVPSDAVAAAVKKAQEKVTVSLVTGRSYGFTEKVLKKLNLHTGYVVVNNGAQVIDLSKKTLLYDQPVDLSDAEEIAALLHAEHIPFYLKQEVFGTEYQNGYFTEDQAITRPYMFYCEENYSSDRMDDIFKKLSHLENLTLHKGHHKDPTRFGLNISHAKATKLHGVVAIMEALHLTKDEIIGIGDGYNDFPLLMASGLKIAMGNAAPDLKSIADFVAPSVDDDGIVTVIEKFILGSS